MFIFAIKIDTYNSIRFQIHTPKSAGVEVKKGKIFKYGKINLPSKCLDLEMKSLYELESL